MDRGLGGLDGSARIWICENPSNLPNPWSIHLATQIQDTTPIACGSSLLEYSPNASHIASQLFCWRAILLVL